jgi:hypothetical protein
MTPKRRVTWQSTFDGQNSLEAAMNFTEMLYGARMLAHVDFPTSEVLG